MARIVVADNDPDALDLLLLDLRLEGHTVAGATSGPAATDLVSSFRPDVVVLDHRMPPGPTGTDTGLALRRADPDLPVIVYSNYQDPEVTARAREGGLHFLAKGNLRALRATISIILARK